MENYYLDIDDTSKMLKLSKSTIYSYVGRNKIPYIKLGGKLLFSQTDLDLWIDTKKQPVITKEGGR
jgi:excisionase family DNA binding protein